MPSTFGTLIFVRDFELVDLEAGSGLSSNDGRGSDLLPARSDGLDNVDGGPDAGFYIEIGIV